MTAATIIADLIAGNNISCIYEKKMFSEIEASLKDKYADFEVEANIMDGKMNLKPIKYGTWKKQRPPIDYDKIVQNFQPRSMDIMSKM